jgi:hypothetical protein|tara:strand:- start:2794 stop:3144 length:351 start_codon:yes stop_codon:yes gene_type:complete
METIHTIETDDLTAKLNKSEIDIIQFIESWLPTFDRWSTKELSYKCQLSEEDGNAAADMLILHGLIENAADDAVMGRQVSVTTDGALWMRENTETINSIKYMIDTDMFDDADIAES